MYYEQQIFLTLALSVAHPPQPDVLMTDVRSKILYYRRIYLDHSDPITFMPLVVDTSGRLYDVFIRLVFFHTHRETSVLVNELPEESDQFRFLRTVFFFLILRVLLT